MSILSTEKAIILGIESIELRTDIPPKTKEQAICLLRSLEKSDWHKSWDKESVIKALKDYKERTGRAPTVTNLKEHGMPKSVTIYSLFHISPSLLLKRLFPENINLRYVNPEIFNPFGFDSEEDWLSCFIEQFNKNKHKGINCRQYNILRDKNTPTRETIARHCGLSSWAELMKKAGVEYPEKKRQIAQRLYVSDAKSPIVEQLKELTRERERLNNELLQILSGKKS